MISLLYINEAKLLIFGTNFNKQKLQNNFKSKYNIICIKCNNWRTIWVARIILNRLKEHLETTISFCQAGSSLWAKLTRCASSLRNQWNLSQNYAFSSLTTKKPLIASSVNPYGQPCGDGASQKDSWLLLKKATPVKTDGCSTNLCCYQVEIACEVRGRKWQWIGYTRRKDDDTSKGCTCTYIVYKLVEDSYGEGLFFLPYWRHALFSYTYFQT